MTNVRKCSDRVWVDIDRVAGSGYLGQDEVALEVSCRRIGCAWQGPTWDPKQGGPMSVDDLLEFQKAHDRWVDEGERVRFGDPEALGSGNIQRRIFLDLVPVGWYSRSSLGGHRVSLDNGGIMSGPSIESIREFVERYARR